MRNLLTATLACVVCTTALSFGQPAATAEQQLLKADADRFKAMVDRDVAMLDRLVAVELSYIQATGRIEDKHAFLYGIKSGKTTYSSIIPSERQVHVMGTVATVIGVVAIRGAEADGGDSEMRYTSVHVLRDGRWQMVAWQSTRIAPNETVNPRRG
jgi:ketosteroid isomerase-like protein